MLERVVDVAGASGLSPIVAVVPPSFEPMGTTVVVNDRPEEGLSRSLRLGIEAVPAGVDAVVILLGDQPTVSSATIGALIAKASGERPVVATRAEGRIGPPILLRREAFGLVAETSGDEGLAPVLTRHPDLVGYVDVPAHAPDVDTPAELAALEDALAAEALR